MSFVEKDAISPQMKIKRTDDPAEPHSPSLYCSNPFPDCRMEAAAENGADHRLSWPPPQHPRPQSQYGILQAQERTVGDCDAFDDGSFSASACSSQVDPPMRCRDGSVGLMSRSPLSYDKLLSPQPSRSQDHCFATT
jgi:hypothetical protein